MTATRSMILLTFRHGFRAAEVVDLRWEQIDFKTATLHVRRVKNGTPGTHPLTGREMRALRKHQRDSAKSPFVFVSERGAPITPHGFSVMVERAGVAADLGIKAHAHMLRHACGFKLANDGVDTRSLQAYLGHKNIQYGRYAALAPDRFKDFRATADIHARPRDHHRRRKQSRPSSRAFHLRRFAHSRRRVKS